MIDHPGNLQTQLVALQQECERLRAENACLRGRLPPPKVESVVLQNQPDTATVSNHSSPADKIKFFRSLFRGREDVYPVRWEGRQGKAGYSPACQRDWNASSHKEAKANRKFFPLTDAVIYDHLVGRQTLGVYPLLPDETCWFLAADFDKSSWQEDAQAFQQTCAGWNIAAFLERSRSGRGGHVWIFFAAPIPASLARKLGAAVLTQTMERRHQVGLDSYDRFFPSQDTMPKGGFGNLIALPLQAVPRKQGNSVFLNDALLPYPDQWAFLSSVCRMNLSEIEAIVQQAERMDRIVGVRKSATDDDLPDDPWTLPPSKRRKDDKIAGPFPARVKIIRSNLVYVEKDGLPSAMLNRLLRLAAFQNPEFYKAQAMRLSTFDKPRIIRCAEEFPRHIGLPRGCFDEVSDFLKTHGIEIAVDDQRFSGKPITAEFCGQLRPEQQIAADALLSHDDGILCATTAFGKTVVAAGLIAARKVNTLILVHRRQLMDQWRERLALFLGRPVKSIGQIGGGKRSVTDIIDVAVIQSLNQKQAVDDVVANYGQVIVDECHHLSAVSFEQVLRQVKARYVAGLTATPRRKDGHHPIIMMQCGPIHFQVNAKAQALARPFKHSVIPRPTNFRLMPSAEKPGIHEVYAALAENAARNGLITLDLVRAIKAGRSPVLLTERTAHVDEFAIRLNGLVKHIIVLKGGMGIKQRRTVAERMAAIPDGEERVLLATGRYLGEGFDDARLDTLFLAMPISWSGTLQQYVGRLHRLHDNKREVLVYDYVDDCVPVLSAMFRKRIRGYEAVGYTIQDDSNSDF